LLGLITDIIKNTPWIIYSEEIDYPVPALGFSYKDKTPTQALALCAHAIGAMMKVDDELQKIIVVLKWPVMLSINPSLTTKQQGNVAAMSWPIRAIKSKALFEQNY
jgi:hypothetical protein